MNTPSEKSEFLLLFRSTNWHRELSPEEIQKTMGAWMAWFNDLVAEGKCKGGHPLGDEGKVVSGKAGAVSDGPFAESKEAVAGYFYLQVSGLDEAIAIAKNCPALEHGLTVEVRPVLASCAAMEFMDIGDAHATAGV